MIIKQLIENDIVGIYVPKVKKYCCVNVGFLTTSFQEDEVQLNIEHNIRSKEGINELSELFVSLCKELNTTSDSVIYIDVIGTADTKKQLLSRNY